MYVWKGHSANTSWWQMSDTWEDAGTRKELEVTGEEPTIGEKEAGGRQILGLRRMSGATGSEFCFG